MQSLFDARTRSLFLERFRRLRPDASPAWGRMSASQMLAHLSDQMRHALGDATCAPIRGPLRWPLLKPLVLYWLPWPRGRAKGPPEAFLTAPTTWARDLETFEQLVMRFAAQEARSSWPDHALFGSMSGRAWGIFCCRHFDYHLRQFRG